MCCTNDPQSSQTFHSKDLKHLDFVINYYGFYCLYKCQQHKETMSAVNDYNTHINNNNFFHDHQYHQQYHLHSPSASPLLSKWTHAHYFLIHNEMIFSYLTLMADKNSFCFSYEAIAQRIPEIML